MEEAIFALSFCSLVFASYILNGLVIGNQTPSFHHIYEPGWDYQAKLKLLAGSDVPNNALPEVYHYLLPGLELG